MGSVLTLLDLLGMASKPMGTIAAHVITCINSFNRLRSLLQTPNCLFQDQIPLSAVVDELGRFRVWSGNIGGLQTGPASLDYRLREASHVRQQVIKLLADLNFALQEASSIISGERLQGEYTSSDHELDLEFSSEGTSLNSDSDSELEMGRTLSEDGSRPTTEVRELFRAVIEAITSLFKLSMVIRNPAPRDRYAKSAIITPYDDRYDIGHVWEKFPHARRTPWLITRLGKVITRTRHYHQYREKHHEKLASVPKVGESRDHPEAVYLSEHETLSEQAATRRTSSSISDTTLQSPTTASTYVAQSVNTIEELSDKTSVTSFATSVAEDDPGHMRVPPPPEESVNEMPFECPHCYTIQTIRDSHSWQRHVFNDLSPYVCTFEDCALKQFESRHKWFDHEMQSHRKEWHCQVCQYSCHSVDDMEIHMRANHYGSFLEPQLPALLELCERQVDKIPANACPLCDTWATLLRARMSMIEEDLSQNLFVTPKQFRSHLGRHMEQLALFALPKFNEHDVNNANSNAAAAGDDSEDGSDNRVMLPAAVKGRNVTVIKKGAEVNARPEVGDTELHRAAISGQEDLLETLLNGGTDIDVANQLGETALHQAARNGYGDVLHLLYAKGANVDVKDLSGSTSLHRAAERGLKAIVGQLLDYGADVEARDLSGATALRRAATKGHEAVVRLLIKEGCDIDAKDLGGSTALHWAASKGYDAVVHLLLQNEADVDARDVNLFTPLFKAASRGHDVVALMLLEKGADPEVVCLKGQMPLLEVASKGHVRTMRLLLENGADLDRAGPRNMTSLHLATYREREGIVRLLLNKGVNVNALDDDGWTALHGAASKGSKIITQLLLEEGNGIDINAQDNGGLTPLHRAAMEGSDDVVRVLLMKGANINVKAKTGETAVDLAAKGRHLGILALLSPLT